jgi:hypothetical protein
MWKSKIFKFKENEGKKTSICVLAFYEKEYKVKQISSM